MKWHSFEDKKPEEGKPLITRFEGKDFDVFETWGKWEDRYRLITFPDGTGSVSHWWDGEHRVLLAKRAWEDGASATSWTAEPEVS